MPNIEKYFGSQFLQRERRVESYRFLQELMEGTHTDWSVAPDTEVSSASYLTLSVSLMI